MFFLYMPCRTLKSLDFNQAGCRANRSMWRNMLGVESQELILIKFTSKSWQTMPTSTKYFDTIGSYIYAANAAAFAARSPTILSCNSSHLSFMGLCAPMPGNPKFLLYGVHLIPAAALGRLHTRHGTILIACTRLFSQTPLLLFSRPSQLCTCRTARQRQAYCSGCVCMPLSSWLT